MIQLNCIVVGIAAFTKTSKPNGACSQFNTHSCISRIVGA